MEMHECEDAATNRWAPVMRNAGGSLVSRSGAITAGGTAQQLMPANAKRRGWCLQNNSAAALWVNELGAAASAGQPAICVPAGALYETPAGAASIAAVSVFGATTGQAFTAREW